MGRSALKPILILSLLAGMMPLAASAQSQAEVDSRRTAAFSQCLNSDLGQSGYGFTHCLGEEHARQDKALNQRYRAVMAKLGKRQQQRLRALQRQWIRDRDAACEQAQTRSGSINAQPWTQCMIDETIRRTIWLERYR